MAGLDFAGDHILRGQATGTDTNAKCCACKSALGCAVLRKLASFVPRDGKLAQPKSHGWHCVGFSDLGSDARNAPPKDT